MYVEPTPRSILSTLFRQKLKFLAVFLVIGLAGFAHLKLAIPLYESHGSILVKFGVDAKPDVSTNGHSTPEGTASDHREIIESDVQILQSHDLLLTLVREFGAVRLYPLLREAKGGPEALDEIAVIQLAKKDLTVKAAASTNVIDIRLQNQNPQLAAQFVKRVIEQFVTRQTDVFNRPQIDFINDQLKRASDELEIAQQSLKTFKAKSGLSSLEEEQSQLLSAKSETQSAAMQNISETQAKLNELRIKEVELLATYRPDSFPAKKLHESILVTERLLKKQQLEFKQTSGVKDPSIINDNNRNQQTNALAEHIEDLGNRIDEIEKQRNDFNDLQRQVQIKEENYKSYQNRLEEARANAVLNEQKITRISVLDEPVVSVTPSYPNKKFIVLLTVLAALLAGLGVALLVEVTDQRFVNPEQVAKNLQIPVLATFTLVTKKY